MKFNEFMNEAGGLVVAFVLIGIIALFMIFLPDFLWVPFVILGVIFVIGYFKDQRDRKEFLDYNGIKHNDGEIDYVAEGLKHIDEMNENAKYTPYKEKKDSKSNESWRKIKK